MHRHILPLEALAARMAADLGLEPPLSSATDTEIRAWYLAHHAAWVAHWAGRWAVEPDGGGAPRAALASAPVGPGPDRPRSRAA